MTSNQYDVLIVGCGPAGATLANLLRLRGRSVAIFDRDLEVFHAPRAMMLDAESCRLYASMGILDRMIPEDASPFEDHRFVDENRRLLMHVDLRRSPQVEGQPAAGMMFHQPTLEALLRDDFAKGSGVDAYLGHEVVEVDGSSDAARLLARGPDGGDPVEYRGQFLVGADGGASLCRRTIGANRVDLDYQRSWVVMDVVVHDQELFDSLDEGSEFKCRPNSAVVFVKGHRNHVRFDFEAGDRAEEFGEEDARRLIAEYIDPTSCEIVRRQPYLFYAGLPDRWRSGRLLLVGDAAHQTSPFAGQGLNMGIRDAANLAFKIDLVCRGVAGPGLLDTYQEERWSNCAHLIRGASRRGKMISASNPFAILARNLSFWVGRKSERLSLEMTRKMSSFVPYEAGLIGAGRAAGSRMPQPFVAVEGHPRGLDEVLGMDFALVSSKVAVGADVDWFEAELGGTLVEMGTALADPGGGLVEWLRSHDASCVLIRPDRYVFDASNDANELCRGLREQLQAFGTSEGADARSHGSPQ